MDMFQTKTIFLFALIQAIIATLGSLYFSEILNFIPCTLCWYQRIAMYPLVFILGIGLLSKDKNVYKYVLPLSIIGWIIAFYHVLIQYGVIGESVNTCTVFGSCTITYIHLLDFITIPLMSLTAFTVINGLMFLYIGKRKEDTST